MSLARPINMIVHGRAKNAEQLADLEQQLAKAAALQRNVPFTIHYADSEKREYELKLELRKDRDLLAEYCVLTGWARITIIGNKRKIHLVLNEDDHSIDSQARTSKKAKQEQKRDGKEKKEKKEKEKKKQKETKDRSKLSSVSEGSESASGDDDDYDASSS